MTPATGARTRASDRAACVAIARRHDPQRFLACLFAPADRQDALIAVLAANHEIAKTAETVSEPMIGRIRLEWWRESLDGIASGAPRSHEVVRPLGASTDALAVSLDPLRSAIDARELDLEHSPFDTLDDLERYAGATGGAVHGLLAEILGADPDPARACGTAWALLGMVRAAPFMIASGRQPFPNLILHENGITHENILDNMGSIDLSPIVAPIVRRAAEILTSAGPAETGGPIALRLLRDRAGDHLRSLQRAGCNPLDPAVASIGSMLVWRYAVRALGYRLGL